ncbi:hypothetical protein Q4100_06495 [Acinetobacter baumannii]
MVENRLSISLWGYGSLNWFDIKDVVRIANKPKINIPKFVLEGLAALKVAPKDQPCDVDKIRSTQNKRRRRLRRIKAI